MTTTETSRRSDRERDDDLDDGSDDHERQDLRLLLLPRLRLRRVHLLRHLREGNDLVLLLDPVIRIG